MSALLLAAGLLAAPPPLVVAGRLERGTVSDSGLSGFQFGARWQALGLGGALDVSRLDIGTAATAMGGHLGWSSTWFAASAGVRWQSEDPAWTPRGVVRLGPSNLQIGRAHV